MKSLFFLALLLPGFALAEDATWGLNVYGLSYHFDRDTAQRIGTDNELNPGLGVRYRRPLNPSFEFFADAGAYKDSGRNTAVLAGAGALWRATGRLRLGGALVALQSDTYNAGDAFVAPLPVAALDFDRVTFNMVYLPKISNFNAINTLGFWATVWLR
ncbi:MAG: hypothetical protein ACT4P4_16765 [Betaproteobacteria bacterium]